MKKQTAVDWLTEQIPLGFRMYLAENGIDLNQAKAMEKQQIIAANEDCSTNELGEFYTGEQYYNETYINEINS
jgi:hypothetical protein